MSLSRRMKRRLVVLPERSCGECSACCDHLDLYTEGTDGCPKVAHAPGGSCSIHPERPSTCRGYQCAWRIGHGQDSDRPDRLGILVHLVYSAALSECILDVQEIRPGALDLGGEDPPGFLAQLIRSHGMIGIDYNGKPFVGGRMDKIGKVTRKVAEQVLTDVAKAAKERSDES